MYQVIIKDKVDCSHFIAQAFVKDQQEAGEIKEYIENNYFHVIPEVNNVELMNFKTAIQTIENTLWKSQGIKFDQFGKEI